MGDRTQMAADEDAVPGGKPVREYLPYLVIMALGAVLLLIANTYGAGDSRFRYILYFSLTALLSVALLHTFSLRERFKFNKGFYLALGLFSALILISALSFIWGSDIYNGIQALFLLVSYALAFALAYLLIREERRAWLFMGMVTVVSMSLCVYGLIQYFINFSDFVAFLALHNVGFEFSDRVFSHFINPNVFASFLNIAIPLALALVLVEKRRTLTFVWSTALLLELWCLYLTQSRGGWISFAVILVLFAILVPRGAWRNKWKVLAVLLLIVVAVISLSSLYSPLEREIQGVKQWEYSGLDVTTAAGSLRGRMGIWRGGLDMFSHNLMGGVGVGGFGTAMQRYQYRAYYSAHAHNYLLETGAETGIFGLLLLLALSLLVLSRIRQVFKGKLKGNIRIMAVALWVVAVGFFLHNLIDFSWFNPLTGVTFWLCAGALFALTGVEWRVKEVETEEEKGGKEGEEEETGEATVRGRDLTRSTIILSLLLAVAVIMSGYLLTNYFLAETYWERGSDLGDIGRELEAIDELQRSLDYIETNPSVHKILGDLYRTLYGDALRGAQGSLPLEESSEKALAHYNRAIELGPEDAYKYQARGLLLIAMDAHHEARRSLEEAQRLYPHNPAPFYFEGRSFSDQEILDKAEEKYGEAVALLPFYADPSIVPYREREGLGIVLDALYRLVKIMVIKGDSEGALELIDWAMNELPDDGRPYAFRGWVHEERGETEKALADYRTAVELEPRLMGVHLAMGKIYKQMGDYEKAVIEFELELEVNPWSIEAQEELESLTGGG